MHPRLWLLCTQVCICVALGVSAVLYLHYLNPADSDFCALRSGCEAARKSPFSYFGTPYVSLPLFALLAWSALLGLSLRRGQDRPQALQRTGLAALWVLPEVTLFAAAGLGGVIAVGLIGYQAFVLREYCWLCVIVDASALLAAGCALGWANGVRGAQVLPESPLKASAWLAVTPSRVRATILKCRQVRHAHSRPVSYPSGAQSSVPGASRLSNVGGRTPATRYATPFTMMSRPTRVLSEPNRLLHKPCDSITTRFAPWRSSSARNPRPSIGFTPSTSKNRHVTRCPASRVVSVPSLIVGVQ